VTTHKELRVWNQAIELAAETHRVVSTFSREDRITYGDQFRRAAVSVALNLAEGAARQHRREFLQFLSIARGSVAELHTLREIALRLGLADEERLARMSELLDHTGRMLTQLVRAIASYPSTPAPE